MRKGLLRLAITGYLLLAGFNCALPFSYIIGFNTRSGNFPDSVQIKNTDSGDFISLKGDQKLILSDEFQSDIDNLENYGNQFKIEYLNASVRLIVYLNAGLAELKIFTPEGKGIIHYNGVFESGTHAFHLMLPKGVYLLALNSVKLNYKAKILNFKDLNPAGMISYTGMTTVSPFKIRSLDEKPARLFYQAGNIIQMKGFLNDKREIQTDRPGQDKQYEFDFFSCKDFHSKPYETVKIGRQTWMAENLQTDYTQNGVSLREFSNGSDWTSTVLSAVCSYNSSDSNSVVFGKLYNWHSVNDSRNISPAGWHIASDEEWTILTNYLTENNFGFGGNGTDIGKSVSADSQWNIYAGEGKVGFEAKKNNRSGLNLLPGGGRLTNGNFSGLKNHAMYWTSTQNNTTDAWVRYVSYGGDEVYRAGNYKKYFGLSVRCIKDRPATVKTSNASAVTTKSATAGGVITDDGGVPVLSCGICYDTIPVTDFQKNRLVSDTLAGKEFICKMNNLIDNKQYFIRAFTVNREGESWGNEITFTTPVASKPIIRTDEISGISASGAIGGGTIISDGGANIIACGICWSENNNPALTDSHTVQHPDSYSYISYIENLKPGKAYFVRAYASNVRGTTYGSPIAMATLTTLPVVKGIIPSLISPVLISCGGNVVSDGGTTLTDRGICWNTTGEPTLLHEFKSAGNQTGNYYLLISGLIPNQDYFFRSYARNSHGTVYGQTFHLKTTPSSPKIKTGNVNIIGSSSATASGEIIAENGGQIIQKGICWSTRPKPELTDTFIVSNSELNPYYSIISGLQVGKMYYLRAFATNQYGTAYGNELYFYTQAVLPQVTTSEISSICPEKFYGGGNVISDGGSSIIKTGLCWSENPVPTVADSILLIGDTTGHFKSWARGLKPETKYYVRAFASNQVGTSYGNLQTIDTPKKFYPEPVMYNVNDVMRKFSIPGAQLAIFRKGKLVYQKSLGFSDKENNINVMNNDLFRIASVSKPITALAILNLMHKKQLNPDDKVFGNDGILGNYYGYVHPDSIKSKITVQHLLDHKSGWVNEPNDPMFSDTSLNQTQIITDMLLNRPLKYVPGTKEKYSNFGYCVLGRIIEKISGLNYAEYVRQNIFIPSGIKNMMIGKNTEEEKLPAEVKYYQTEFSPYKMNITRMDSHGGWVSNATDLARLLVHFDKDPSVTELLPDSILGKMYFGNTWGFYGSLPGTSSIVSVDHYSDIGYVFVANTRKENDCNKETDPACVTMHDEISIAIRSRFYSITDWPEYDLFE